MMVKLIGTVERANMPRASVEGDNIPFSKVVRLAEKVGKGYVDALRNFVVAKDCTVPVKGYSLRWIARIRFREEADVLAALVCGYIAGLDDADDAVGEVA
jgi:hypothetical protein